MQTAFEQRCRLLSNKPGWGDRSVAEEPDFLFIPVFDKEDDDENMAGVSGVNLVKVLQNMEAFLKSSFPVVVPKKVLRQWRDKFGP